jgi:oxygen-dependent protoporphyrinogen oxidase
MGALTEALSNRLGRFLHPGIKAVAVAADGSGYRIDAEDSASGATTFQLRSRTVVIAVPAAVAAGMLNTLNPALGQLLGGIESAPAVTAGIAFSPADFISLPPRGYGFVRPHCEGARLLGCLFPSSAFEGTAPDGVVHLRVLAGGRRDPDACKLSDGELIDLVRAETGGVLGLRPNVQPSVCHVVRHTIAFPQYEAGHVERVKQIEAALTQHPRLHLAGNSYYGLSVSKVVERAEHLSASILKGRAAA